MPNRSTLLALATAAFVLIPSVAQAAVTDVTISQDADATVANPATATFTANAFDGGSGAVGPHYYWATDCVDETSVASYDNTEDARTYAPVFTTPGSHNVCVFVYSTDFTTHATAKQNFEVTEVDPGPTAALTLSATSAVTGTTITFDASGSHNNVPGALDYTFDVDGDSSNGYEVDNGANPILTHQYLNTFNSSVGVRVIDRDHQAASATQQLTITSPAAPAGSAGNPTPQPSALVDGPLGTVTFTVEPCTINQFLSSGIVTKFQWGSVNAKGAIKVYLVTTKKVRGKKKTSKLLITAPTDDVFYAYGSGFTREAKGAAAKALRKLKTAKIEIDWTVTSKQGDKKTGVYTATLKKGL